MPTKIESHLTPEQFREFCKRCAQLRGTKLRDIQALADEFDIEISLMAARSFKSGPFQEYLEELRSKSELAESVAELAKNGVGLSDGAATKFAAKVYDAVDQLELEDIGTEKGNNLSLAIARLRQGDRNAKRLEADLKNMAERLRLAQFDAAKAALEHVRELRVIASDASLDTAQKLERARQRLFGAAPADIRPLGETHGKDRPREEA